MRNKTVQEIDFQGVPLIVVDSKVIGFGIDLLSTIGDVLGVPVPEEAVVEEPAPAPKAKRTRSSKSPKRREPKEIISEDGTFARTIEDMVVHHWMVYGEPLSAETMYNYLFYRQDENIRTKVKNNTLRQHITATAGTLWRKKVLERPVRGAYTPSELTINAYNEALLNL